MKWYEKYLSVYGKPYAGVPAEVMDGIRNRLRTLQSDEPLVSVVVIAYNEEKHLPACLWSLSESVCEYPMEIIGVNNDSADRTADVFEASGIPYHTELQHSCGYARRCGLQYAQGKYYICIDSDTMYPPGYVQAMADALQRPGIVAVSSLWSYMPDEGHPWLGLKIYEFMRDTHLWMQSFKRPELSVRGLVFAYNADYGRKVGYRVDIIRGEDGSMALGLKQYGRIRTQPESPCGDRLRDGRRRRFVPEQFPGADCQVSQGYGKLFYEKGSLPGRRVEPCPLKGWMGTEL